MKTLPLLLALLPSLAYARTIEEVAIPYVQVCVTRAAGKAPQSSLRFQTVDSNGGLIAEQTINISSALMTDAERAQVRNALEAAFVRLHDQLGIPTPSPTPVPTPTPTPDPTPTAEVIP